MPLILEGWKVLCKQQERIKAGTLQMSFFQSRIFHDITKYPPRFSVIYFKNVSCTLSCMIISLGRYRESAGTSGMGWEGLKYVRVRLHNLLGS